MNDITEIDALHLLVVEDNPTDALLLEDTLDQVRGVTISLTLVRRLEEALLRLQGDRFDAVLLDLGLPDSAGLETFTRLQMHHPGVPILVLSGLDDESLALHAVRDGAQDYLVKGKLNSIMLARTIRYAIERKRTETRLTASEMGYRRLFETAQDGIFILDADNGHIVDANPHLEKLLGYSASELSGKSLWEISPFRNQEANQIAFRTLQEKGFIQYDNLPLETKDGRLIDVEFISNLYKVGEQRVIQCSIRDITERKRAESAEQELQRFLQSTLDALASHIAVLDQTGTVIAVNKLWSQFAEENGGTAVCCGVGANYIDVCARARGDWSAEAPLVAEGIQQVMAGQRQIFSLEYPCHSSSQARWFEVRVTRFDGAGPTHLVVAHENITARKLAEAELRESDEKFRQLSNNIIDVFWIRSADMSQVYYVSPAFERIWGRPVESLYSNPGSWLDFIFPEDRARVAAVFAVATTNMEGVDVEYRIVRPDGELRWVRARSFPVRDADDQVIRYTGIVTDITSAMEAQQALESSEERFSNAFEYSAIGMALAELDGRWLQVNKSFCDLLGYSADELRALTFQHVTHPDDLETDLQDRNALLNGMTRFYSKEKRYLHKEGQAIWVQLVVSLVRDSKGNPLYFVGQMQDITERKKSEAASALLSAIVESSEDAIISKTLDGIITSWNYGAHNLYGYTAEEAVGRPVSFLAPPELHDEMPTLLAQLRRGEPVRHYETVRLHKDGSRIDISLSLSPIRDARGNIIGFSSIKRDITQAKRMAQELLDSESQFRTLAEAMPQIVWVTRPDGWHIHFNQRWMDYTGLSLEESLGFGWNPPFHPDDRLRAAHRWQQAIESGEPYDIRYRLRGADGIYRWMLGRALPMRDSTGEITKWFGTCTDIHDLMVAEGELSRANEEQQELTLQLEKERARLVEAQSIAKVGSWELDLRSGTLVWSDENYHIFGIEPGQFQGTYQTALELIHADDRAAVDTAYWESVANRTPYSIDHRVQLKDGSTKVIYERCQTFYDDEGRGVRSVGTSQDITERKQIEEALQRSEALFRTLINSSWDAFHLVEPNGKITYESPAVTRLLGYLPEEMIGHEAVEFVHPDDLAVIREGGVAMLSSPGSKRTVVLRVRHKNGSWRWVESFEVNLVDHPDVGAIAVNYHDITDRKAAEEERDRFFTLSLDMLAITGSDGYFKRLNPAWETTLGYSNTELMAVPFLEFVHPEDIEATLEETAKLSNGCQVMQFENRYRCRDGSYKRLQWMSAPYEDLWYCVAHDVTGDKEAAAALEESEERFRQMSESVDEVFWLFDPVQGQLLYVSPSFDRVWGFPGGDLVEQKLSFLDSVHPEDQPRILAALEHQHEPNGYSEEHRVVRPDGSVIWVWARTFPIYNPQGEVYRIAGVAQDISARKQAEADLQIVLDELESRVQRRTLELERANAETRTRARQQEAVAELGRRALTGCDLETLLTGATSLVADTLDVQVSAILELLPANEALWVRASTGFGPEAAGRRVLMDHNSQAGYALLSQAPVIVTDLPAETRFKPSTLLLEHGIMCGLTVIIPGYKQPFGTLGAHTIEQRHFTQDDVHFLQSMANVMAASLEQRRAEESLYKNHEFLQAVLENTAEGILACDANGQLTIFNRATREFHGLPLEALPPDQWAKYFSLYFADGVTPMEAENVPLYRALRGDHVRDMQMVIAPHEGLPRIVTNNGEPLYGVGGEKLGAVVVMHDVTQRQQAEADLRRAKQEADAANHAKSEFLSRMSHELRTPLNAVLGFGQLLEMSRSLSQKEIQAVDHILKGGRHLLGLINEVLDIARIEAGRISLSPEPVRLSETIRETLDMVRPLATTRHIQILNEIAKDDDRHVLADQQRFRQVLLNLLANAIKYNRDGGRVTLSCVANGSFLCVNVRDTGPGLNVEQISKLFVPFERLGADQSQIEGTGLGLVLSKRLVEAMQGRIGVESVPGQGSTFWVELPLVDSLSVHLKTRNQDPAASPPDADAPRPPAVQSTVLYVEDNLANFEVVETLLGDRPEIRLLSAMQGSIGLDLARQHLPDLILLDLHLPDIEGGVVLHRLRAEPATRGIPVVVLSADATPGRMDKLRDSGIEHYLTKPIDLRQFLLVLDDILSKRNPTVIGGP